MIGTGEPAGGSPAMLGTALPDVEATQRTVPEIQDHSARVPVGEAGTGRVQRQQKHPERPGVIVLRKGDAAVAPGKLLQPMP